METCVLFDAGYLFFYRYHATMKHFKFKGNHEPSEEELVQAFIKHLDQQIVKIKKKLKASKLYFCIDAPRKDLWRTELYSDYKGTRVDQIKGLPDITQEIYDVFDKHGVRLSHPRCEADDIVALCCKKFHHDYKVCIISNDKDFLQLLKYENVVLLDGAMKTIEGTGDPEKDLWIKILCGDKSDNISALLTKKKALAAIESKQLEQYKDTTNYKLVCFDAIPDVYESGFYKTLKKLQAL